MLTWYDATNSLISRRRPVFPRRYIEVLLKWRTETEWSYLSLNGCPDELFPVIHDLAVLAASRTFCMEKAADLEARLIHFQITMMDSELRKLLECWRLGLLLYCARVFNVSPRVIQLQRCRGIAEDILKMVMEISPASQLQKQCLFPMFLAGCEVDAELSDSLYFRTFADAFCRQWSRRTGIRVAMTALETMHQVWDLMDLETGSGKYWWGDVIGRPLDEPDLSSTLQTPNIEGTPRLYAEYGWIFA